jgi:hypothetical protein
MGKKVIPEQVEYFCDVCNSKLLNKHHDDFTLSVDEALYDYSGSKMNNKCDHYELCDGCTSKFKDWLKGIEK